MKTKNKRIFSLLIAMSFIFALGSVVTAEAEDKTLKADGSTLAVPVTALQHSDGLYYPDPNPEDKAGLYVEDGKATIVYQIKDYNDYENVYVFFDVEFTDGASFADYEELHLTFQGISGDVNFKEVKVHAFFDSGPVAFNSTGFILPAGFANTFLGESYLIQDKNELEFEIGFMKNTPVFNQLIEAGINEAKKIRFVVRLHAAATGGGEPTSYSLKDISLYGTGGPPCKICGEKFCDCFDKDGFFTIATDSTGVTAKVKDITKITIGDAEHDFPVASMSSLSVSVNQVTDIDAGVVKKFFEALLAFLAPASG
ncbi:MAG: hypothetical protein FWE74_11260 [Oscillospiraceae bacterium]|nr:hypothetical protein [Oscillospiraceae bacterium]